MNDRPKGVQFILGLLAILLLVPPVVLFIHQIPPISPDISKVQTEDLIPQDIFISSYIIHGPIVITSNTNFSDYGCSGSGTSETPYIIEGYNITTSGDCISIQNTNAYFVIRDCLLTGGGSSKGIEFDGVTNGEIRNTTILGKDFGVKLYSSSNNTVVNNTISNSDNGVGLFSSCYNTVVNNTIFRNEYGVSFDNSSNNTVANSSIFGNEFGMKIEFSSNNISILNNTISGNGYGVYISSSSSTLSSNVFVNNGIYIAGNAAYQVITPDNLVNGKPLGYFCNLNSGTIDASQYGQVIIANCTGLIVKDGVFINATAGLQLERSSYCTLVNNTIFGNEDARFLTSSHNNTVVNNTISGSGDDAMLISSSSDNTVVNNTIYGNYGGVHLTSPNNIIVNNTIFGNGCGVTIRYPGYNIIANNSIFGNGCGVSIEPYSARNLIVGNTISGNRNNGVHFDFEAQYNTLENNTISGNGQNGVSFRWSEYNSLENNIISNNSQDGVYLDWSPYHTFENNTISDNSQNGVCFYRSSINTITNNTISGNLQSGVYIHTESTHNSIASNTISGNHDDGVHLNESERSTLANNIISENHDNGVSVIKSNHVTIVNNTIFGNDDGVYITGTGGVDSFTASHTVKKNTILGNEFHGVNIVHNSRYNLIYLNIIAYNGYLNAYDDGLDTYWDSDGTGNFWSDYNGTGVYHIPGDAGSIDHFPSIFPPDIVPPTVDKPADMNYEESTTGHNITWISNDAYPSHYVILQNGTQVISDSWDGTSISVDIDGLSVGVYNYTIVVNDTTGNWVSDTVIITVLPHGSSTITTNTTSITDTTTTNMGEVTRIVIVFFGIGGIAVVIVLFLIRYRRDTMIGL